VVASTSKPKSGAGDQELIELQKALLSGPTTDVPYAESNPDVVKTFLDRRAAQREAYGQFVAEEDIYDPMGNSKVFTTGMQVPLEHVEMWDLEATGKVKRVASPEEARRNFRPDSIGAGSLIPPPESATPAAGQTK
jgi:hypothetical protein